MEGYFVPENQMVYAAPEAEGVSTQAILEFLDDIKSFHLPLHSYLVMRHGKVLAEGYCSKVFDENRKHRMYSVSKSFTSVAIGMLITEGRLTLNTKIVDVFPEYVTDATSDYAKRSTVRDLLRMATHNEENAYKMEDTNCKDWIRPFIDNGVYHYYQQMPGTVFHYDTAATTTLCAVIEKITGMKMLEYMRPLLDELGISKDIWCIECPDGRSWPGSGIMATTRDLAKFGQFCLHRGEWNGKQLVDRDYMMAATTKQIDRYVTDSALNFPGYGYQFWIIENGFACCGMGGQFAFMFPEQDMVVITTADTQGLNSGDDQIRHAAVRLARKVKDETLTADAALADALAQASQLELPKRPGKTTSPMAAKVSGKTYDLDENRWGYKWLRVDVDENVCTLTYEKKGEVLQLPLYIGEYGEFAFPEKFSGKRSGVLDTNYRCMSQVAWDSEDTLVGTIYCVDDYLGNIRIQLTFVEDTLTVMMVKAAEGFFDDYRGYLCGHEQK